MSIYAQICPAISKNQDKLNKNSFRPFTWNIKGQLRTFDKPLIMGILNVTPDSFYPGSRVSDLEVLNKAEAMLEEGADILDLGGQSTRPGATRISQEEEWMRVAKPVEMISKRFPQALISIDTFYSHVAKNAVEHGASIVNDISAGSLDPQMLKTVASLNVPYILMHMQGEPQTMQNSPEYSDVTGEVIHFLSERLDRLRQHGVNDIAIDPGFGFGKLQAHNITLLRELNTLQILDVPILVGLSRKKMTRDLGNVSMEEALAPSIAAHILALSEGASIIRVHDVKEHRAALSLWLAIKKAP